MVRDRHAVLAVESLVEAFAAVGVELDAVSGGGGGERTQERGKDEAHCCGGVLGIVGCFGGDKRQLAFPGDDGGVREARVQGNCWLGMGSFLELGLGVWFWRTGQEEAELGFGCCDLLGERRVGG